MHRHEGAHAQLSAQRALKRGNAITWIAPFLRCPVAIDKKRHPFLLVELNGDPLPNKGGKKGTTGQQSFGTKAQPDQLRSIYYLFPSRLFDQAEKQRIV